MQDFLVFTLAAPMASFGALAVGERRPTDIRPTKSQILGLIACALGIERSQEEHQAALAASLGFAVLVENPGLIASDYHTAVSPKEVSIRRRARTHGPIKTRSDELACDDRKTILSMREFRTGVLVTISLWSRGPAADLERIATALRAPHFTLFAGRKSFPLMLPCRPVVLSADTVEQALAAYAAGKSEAIKSLEAKLLSGRLPRAGLTRWLYADASAPLSGNRQRTEQRRDMPESRAKWRFGLRQEIVLAMPGGDER